ncbi:MAG: vanadium-dependent haloperoxidase [Chitinophagales bacterium]|nr:vanadium-dependent haloperoxidase [Chitinophagales bacterium]
MSHQRTIYINMLTMRGILFTILCIGTFSCQAPVQEEQYDKKGADVNNSAIIHQLNKELIGVISEDLFPPPVASRIYAYANVAAYEAVRGINTDCKSLAGQLNDLAPLTLEDKGEMYWEIAMISSFTEVAKHLVYRDFMLDTVYQHMIDTLKVKYLDETKFKASIERGLAVAKHIKEWADKDGYQETRNMPRYEPLEAPYAWEATAPMYGEALEPHWYKLRPFVMDSASQYRAPLTIEFSTEENSTFYKAAEEVYDIVVNAKPEDIDIAVYWDCNPGPTMVDGHSMQVRKQNTPGGHWVGIHSILAQKSDKTLSESCAVYAKLCTGVADGFIAAWDTKYAHHLLRPETFINRYIDKDWRPKLESPLFPEFTSAHSLISAVAASVLSGVYGEMAFFDDTNMAFGLPPKQFENVWIAADEAARSRLLGGIHYVFACETGFEQGKELGKLINESVKTSE